MSLCSFDEEDGYKRTLDEYERLAADAFSIADKARRSEQLAGREMPLQEVIDILNSLLPPDMYAEPNPDPPYLRQDWHEDIVITTVENVDMGF